MYLEKAWDLVRAAGNKVRGVIIIDVSNCGLSMLGYISVIKQLSSAGVLRYPEITERVYVVNAGWVMSTLWSAIKPLLPTRTEAKFRILHDHGAASILSEIEGGVLSLPDFVGGSLRNGQHLVCPAVSVDDAYEIVMNEILSTSDIYQYIDLDEFLVHALNDAKKYPKSAKHQSRIKNILKIKNSI